VNGVDHLIRDPKQIRVDHELDWLRSVEVVDAEDNHHIILLKNALELPAT
jgi:hypothetical protein